MHGPLNVQFALSFTFSAWLGQKFGKEDIYKNFYLLNGFEFCEYHQSDSCPLIAGISLIYFSILYENSVLKDVRITLLSVRAM